MKDHAGHGESDNRAKFTAELFAPAQQNCHPLVAARAIPAGCERRRASGATRLDDDARHVPQPTLRPQNCRGADEDAIAARSGHSAKSSIAETKPSRPADAVASMSSGPGEHVRRLKVSDKRGRPTWSRPDASTARSVICSPDGRTRRRPDALGAWSASTHSLAGALSPRPLWLRYSSAVSAFSVHRIFSMSFTNGAAGHLADLGGDYRAFPDQRGNYRPPARSL